MAGYNEVEECEGVGLGGRMDRALVFFRAAGMFALMGGEQALPRSNSREKEDEWDMPLYFRMHTF